MGKNTIVHKCKLWSMCLVIMCGILFFSPTVQTEVSSKNSWSVKINNKYRGKIVRKGNECYLQCTGVQMKKLKAAKRVAYMDVSSKSGFNSGNWSVYVENLKTGDILSINEISMYPASVIKLFVMEAVYASGSEKRINLNGTVKSLLNSMITVSDNECYNELVKPAFESGAPLQDSCRIAFWCEIRK